MTIDTTNGLRDALDWLPGRRLGWLGAARGVTRGVTLPRSLAGYAGHISTLAWSRP